ncbi:MAG: FIST C-terminal domain-containing protein [Treponema sp.]|jgi:hypothetical protein|nr:FIST C-terminal domain-containing protein [Treponema sp.]
MLRVLTASTENIDDLDAAINDIKTQLDMDNTLLKNTVGIIACHYEFANAGTVKAICGVLPFEVCGTISSTQGLAGVSANLLLTLMVLTSDDLSFKTLLTSSLRGPFPSEKDSVAGTIREAYTSAVSDRADMKPSLIFVYAPFMPENSGDEYVNVLTDVSGGAPCFGTLAVDDTVTFSECYLLYNGEKYRDRMAMILVYGDCKPRFFLAAISENKFFDRPALITASAGHILKEVNGRPVSEYFESMGLTKASETSYAMTSLPFMVDYNDGTPPVSKVFIGLNEDRYAICAGAMPEGSTLYLGVFDKDDVLLTSRKAVQEALSGIGNSSGMLIYSCISRSMTLGSELFAEIKLVQEEIGGKLPFLMAYSGGEICPTLIKQSAAKEETAINRFHNNTLILCIL